MQRGEPKLEGSECVKNEKNTFRWFISDSFDHNATEYRTPFRDERLHKPRGAGFSPIAQTAPIVRNNSFYACIIRSMMRKVAAGAALVLLSNGCVRPDKRFRSRARIVGAKGQGEGYKFAVYKLREVGSIGGEFRDVYVHLATRNRCAPFSLSVIYTPQERSRRRGEKRTADKTGL